MEMETLQDLLLDEIKDIYSAEQQLAKALPKMAKKATSKQLKQAFETHLKETLVHAERLESVFEAFGEKAKAKKCLAMEGLLKEGKEIMGEDMEDDVMDAALICAAQKVEHYEIASYGTVRTYAQLLGNKEATKLLQQTLDEEGKTDKLLTKLAESINVEAAQPA